MAPVFSVKFAIGVAREAAVLFFFHFRTKIVVVSEA
jgi:hypothetical protein